MSDRRKDRLRFEPDFKRVRIKDSDYQKKMDRIWGEPDYEKDWKKTDWTSKNDEFDDDYWDDGYEDKR